MAHEVIIKKDSICFSLFQREKINVNSIHHQAIKQLGENLITSGISEKDNLIEVIENKSGNILAVQWHPETMWQNPLMKDEQLSLFRFLLRN